MTAKHYRWLTIAVVALLLAGFGVVQAQTETEEEVVKVTSKEKAFMGVYPDNLDEDDREALNFEGEGVLIEDVVDEGPSEKAGIEAGDIVIRMDNKTISSTRDLRGCLKGHKPGDKMKVVVIRKGKEKDFKVKLGEQPEEMFSFNFPKHFPFHGRSGCDKGGFLGVHTTTLEDQLADYFEVESGALVEKVVSESPAEKAGLKAGDVITGVEDDEVVSTSDLIEAVRDRDPGSEVKLKVVRRGKDMAVKTTLGEVPAGKMGRGIKKRVVVDWDEEDFDLDELMETIHEALEDIDIQMDSGGRELREEMDELRKELKELKKELRENKKE